MDVVLDQRIPRTLDTLLARFCTDAYRGARIEAWLFEDFFARAEAEKSLARAGVRAKLRAAYKSLIHFFLEESPGSADAVTVFLPAHPLASAARFRLEAFPLAGLIAPASLRFAAGDAELHYRVAITCGGATSEHLVFAPNRVGKDHLGEKMLTPSGWLRVWRDGGDGAPDEDAPLTTEYETAFAAAMGAIAAHPWPTAMPFFDVLKIDVSAPGIERRIAWHDECLSTAEGLHEDLYFSTLEFFQRHAGLKLGDRTLQPGQIFPDIRTESGPARVRVALEQGVVSPEPPEEPIDIETASEPLTPAQIGAALDDLGGARITAVSRQGRTVEGVFVDGVGRGFVITAGQHANETTGVVGALRAATRLRAEGAKFAVIPQENVDGYALHRRLREGNPRHMHHAARYTALGDDLQFRMKEPLYEKAARLEAYRLTAAGLHMNLHGYPAHEWNRPLTGYVTRGFEAWSMPRGFYFILRFPPGFRAPAIKFLEALAARVALVPGLPEFNASQIAAWSAHAGETPEPIFSGISCTLTEVDNPSVPFMLITEYPDETIYGADFRLGHDAQMATVLAAAELYRGGMLTVG
jgi:hypothetical protein